MIPKIADRHLSRQACIYIRQSTLAQVRFNQESTDRQYNLMNKARSLGWSQEQIRVLDRDLGKSGAAAGTRTDFKTLVGDVAMGQVGAIFSLEASRLARSNQDWHRLLELCAITGTVVIDEDGVYDPADFNDGLVLGMRSCTSFARASTVASSTRRLEAICDSHCRSGSSSTKTTSCSIPTGRCRARFGRSSNCSHGKAPPSVLYSASRSLACVSPAEHMVEHGMASSFGVG